MERPQSGIFGKICKRARLREELTQEIVSRGAGLTQSLYSKVERGEFESYDSFITNLAHALRVSDGLLKAAAIVDKSGIDMVTLFAKQRSLFVKMAFPYLDNFEREQICDAIVECVK